jgi:hypothetical protein
MSDPRIRPRRDFAAGGDGLWGKESVLYGTPGRPWVVLHTIYLVIIILLISSLRALLLPSFIFVWMREGVHGVSEGGDNTRGRLGI